VLADARTLRRAMHPSDAAVKINACAQSSSMPMLEKYKVHNRGERQNAKYAAMQADLKYEKVWQMSRHGYGHYVAGRMEKGSPGVLAKLGLGRMDGKTANRQPKPNGFKGRGKLYLCEFSW
jgi:hypothetical protein